MIIIHDPAAPDTWGRAPFPSTIRQTTNARKFVKRLRGPTLPALRGSRAMRTRARRLEVQTTIPSQFTNPLYVSPSSGGAAGLGQWDAIQQAIGQAGGALTQKITEVQEEIQTASLALKISTVASVVSALVVILRR